MEINYCLFILLRYISKIVKNSSKNFINKRMASSNPSCSRRNRLKPCYFILRHLLAFLVVGHLIIQNGVECTDHPEPEMSCYSCDQSGSEAGGDDDNENDLCINPNPATDANPSTTLACPEPDTKCASIRLVHHYGDNVAVVNLGADEKEHEDKDGDDQGDKSDQEDEKSDGKDKIDKEDEGKHHEGKEKTVEHEEKKHDKDKEKTDKDDEKKKHHEENKNGSEGDKDDKSEDDGEEKKEHEAKNEKEDKKEEEVKRSDEDKKDDKEDDDDEAVRKRSTRRRKRSIPRRRKRSSVTSGSDTSYVEIARKGCTSEKRVKAALDCFRNLFHHPYQRYLGKCTVTQFGREGFLLIKQKCEPGTLPKDMRVDMDRQDKFYLLLCTCEGDLCNDKELLELDKRVFIPEIKAVGNGTPWDEGWGRLGSGGAHEEDDDDEAMRKKFKSGGEIRKVGFVLIVVAIGVLVTRGKF